jgi:hypothetical protein
LVLGSQILKPEPNVNSARNWRLVLISESTAEGGRTLDPRNVTQPTIQD